MFLSRSVYRSQMSSARLTCLTVHYNSSMSVLNLFLWPSDMKPVPQISMIHLRLYAEFFRGESRSASAVRSLPAG